MQLWTACNYGVVTSMLLAKHRHIAGFRSSRCMAWQEQIGWEHAHVVGHSMGAMIALKLAAAHPERIDSLTLISTTAGHFQCIPRSWRALWYTVQVGLAACSAGISVWCWLGHLLFLLRCTDADKWDSCLWQRPAALA